MGPRRHRTGIPVTRPISNRLEGWHDGRPFSDASDRRRRTSRPELVREPLPDLASVSFIDNLLSKEADLEWSHDEGPVATLQLFAGKRAEAEGRCVVRVLLTPLEGIAATSAVTRVSAAASWRKVAFLSARYA